jgi:hypothetical protein
MWRNRGSLGYRKISIIFHFFLSVRYVNSVSPPPPPHHGIQQLPDHLMIPSDDLVKPLGISFEEVLTAPPPSPAGTVYPRMRTAQLFRSAHEHCAAVQIRACALRSCSDPRMSTAHAAVQSALANCAGVLQMQQLTKGTVSRGFLLWFRFLKFTNSQRPWWLSVLLTLARFEFVSAMMIELEFAKKKFLSLLLLLYDSPPPPRVFFIIIKYIFSIDITDHRSPFSTLKIFFISSSFLAPPLPPQFPLLTFLRVLFPPLLLLSQPAASSPSPTEPNLMFWKLLNWILLAHGRPVHLYWIVLSQRLSPFTSFSPSLSIS